MLAFGLIIGLLTLLIGVPIFAVFVLGAGIPLFYELNVPLSALSNLCVGANKQICAAGDSALRAGRAPADTGRSSQANHRFPDGAFRAFARRAGYYCGPSISVFRRLCRIIACRDRCCWNDPVPYNGKIRLQQGILSRTFIGSRHTGADHSTQQRLHYLWCYNRYIYFTVIHCRHNTRTPFDIGIMYHGRDQMPWPVPDLAQGELV